MAIETTRELFNSILQAGVSKDGLIRDSGIDYDELEQSESRYPVKNHLKLWQSANKLLSDNTIGIQMGAGSDPFSRGIVGLAFSASPTLDEAVANKIRYTKILADHILLGLEKTDTTFTMDYSILDGYFHQLEIERVFAGFLNWVRTFVNRKVNPIRLSFQYSAPQSLQIYEKYFQCPMEFDQPRNLICLDAELLKIKNASFNEYLYSILKTRADSVLSSLDSRSNFLDDVQTMIAGRLSHGNFSAEEISASLNMSKRSLHRRLSENNISFQGLLDDVRKTVAISYLAKSSCSVKNVPYLVGYSDPRSFHRAFKRWMGCSLNEYLSR